MITTKNRLIAWAFVKLGIPIVYRVGELKFCCPDKLSMWRADTLYTKEPETIKWIDTHAGQGILMVDIGASTGIYSVYAASKGSLVLAYESNPAIFKILKKTASLNNGLIWVVNAAVGKCRQIDVVPYMVKIDTDGAEVEILETNATILKKAKTIMIEESPEAAAEIQSLLGEYGFTCEGRYISEMMKNSIHSEYRNAVWVR